MATLRDVIKASLQSIGALAQGESPSADEEEEARLVCNRMLGSWAAEGLLVHAKVREEFTLVVASASRTIGATGNYATTRPVRYLRATIEDQSASGTPESPVEMITTQQWADITDKATTAALPTKIYLENTYPNDTINFWPVPSAANKLVLYTEKPLTAFTSVSTTFSFPEGYEEAVVLNLGKRLAKNYGKMIDQDYFNEAINLKANLQVNNSEPRYLTCDAALLGSGGYDIYKGY